MPTQVTSILYPARDLDGAKAIFSTLFGLEPMADSPYYVGYDVNGLQIGLVSNGQDEDMVGPHPYIQVTTGRLVAARRGYGDTKLRVYLHTPCR